MGRDVAVSEYWRILMVGRVFKLFSVGGYSRADMDLLYPGAIAKPITHSEFMQ